MEQDDVGLAWFTCCMCDASAADGQHIYMHAVNIRCLVRQYGSLRDCPDTVTATVLELESVSMDEVSTDLSLAPLLSACVSIPFPFWMAAK